MTTPTHIALKVLPALPGLGTWKRYKYLKLSIGLNAIKRDRHLMYFGICVDLKKNRIKEFSIL